MEKKYIYANVKIPLEITEDTYEYKLLREYIDVTFQKCEENPRQGEPSPYFKEPIVEKIKRLFVPFPTTDSNLQKNHEEGIISPQTIAELLTILPNEIKKKLPSKNISFKQKPRILNKRTTAKVYQTIASSGNVSVNEKEGVGLSQDSGVQEQVREDGQ